MEVRKSRVLLIRAAVDMALVEVAVKLELEMLEEWELKTR